MQLIDIMKNKDLFGGARVHPDGTLIEEIFTDKGCGHSYIQNFYEDEFKKYQDKDINFLEIGILSGGCFLLWKEYFKNAKNIIGVDCNEDNIHPDCRNIEGVDYYFGDAYDEKFVESLDLNFDIIVDDGPHTLESQLKLIELYLPKLNKGGVLVVEDIAREQYFEQLIQASKKVEVGDDSSDVEYEVECFDFRSPEFHQESGKHNGLDKLTIPDDMLFVVRKL